ncbi:MAG: Pyridoxamine 5-phosphate oxidase-related protein [Gemmatimonadetes bacterium]|jgi:nitroimidazol reductase NimA-like FMN-containing flavoprotein (pyridoxamine 5'-phosphate oxidase superfamily)|nr:Pyridoxamine 5-phosphate oxidase-related protein [Gemmatimonadota bacterium]
MSNPQIRTLDEEEARAFLARCHVGRIAFSFHDRVDIEPLHYVFDGEWIFARTSLGSKVATLAHRPWCAFEADEAEGVFSWTSVVARGSVHLLDPEGGSVDTYARALAAVRGIVPETFSTSDPAPHRTQLLGIYVQEITGRTATQ